MIELDKHGDLWVLTMASCPKGEDGTNFDNCFNPGFLEDMNKALDVVEKDGKGKRCALITTSRGKIYSSGLDLSWLMSQEYGGKVQLEFMDSFHRFLHRVLTFPIPTIAAMNGHAFGGGFLLALAHDYRVMNVEKGFVAMTEIDIGATLTRPLNALIKEKLPRALAAKIMLEGCRLSGAELKKFQVVDDAVDPEQVVARAKEIGEFMAPKGSSPAYGPMKEDLYCDAAKILVASL
mmetsp:Transcript_11160/g.20740  ORF Transcript_11160/g.20740 Transcript_11160/m.20740 type:complete len:235 (-) Transcript_11160:2682-3386(-)